MSREGTEWQPGGKSPNPSGRPKKLLNNDSLRKMIARIASGGAEELEDLLPMLLRGGKSPDGKDLPPDLEMAYKIISEFMKHDLELRKILLKEKSDKEQLVLAYDKLLIGSNLSPSEQKHLERNQSRIVNGSEPMINVADLAKFRDKKKQ